jgi:hypothetical protein
MAREVINRFDIIALLCSTLGLLWFVIGIAAYSAAPGWTVEAASAPLSSGRHQQSRMKAT